MPVHPPEQVNGRDRCVALMLERHADSLDIARTLAALGEEFATRAEIGTNEPNKLLPVCILIRQISGLRSLCLLAVNGFYTEALGHQRGLMEALARIAALVKKPDLLQDYLVQDVLNRRKLLNDMLNFRRDWGPEVPRDPTDDELRRLIEQAQALLDAFKQEHGRDARDIKTFDWAQTGEVAHLLFGRFVIASGALHFSPRSLDHLFIMDGGQLKAVRIGAEDKDLDHLILSSCRYVFVGIQTVAQSLGVEVPNDIDALYHKFQALYEKKADEASAAV